MIKITMTKLLISNNNIHILMVLLLHIFDSLCFLNFWSNLELGIQAKHIIYDVYLLGVDIL